MGSSHTWGMLPALQASVQDALEQAGTSALFGSGLGALTPSAGVFLESFPKNRCEMKVRFEIGKTGEGVN